MIHTFLCTIWVPLIVLCVFATAGCSRSSGIDLASTTPAQPYDQLVYLSGAQVKERLGEPSVVETHAKEATWRYNDLKLHVSLFEDRVSRVDVEGGPITDGLAIGDDEAQVQQLTSQVEVRSSGLKSYVLQREKLWYRFVVRDSKILKAAVEVPALP